MSRDDIPFAAIVIRRITPSQFKEQNDKPSRQFIFTCKVCKRRGQFHCRRDDHFVAQSVDTLTGLATTLVEESEAIRKVKPAGDANLSQNDYACFIQGLFA